MPPIHPTAESNPLDTHAPRYRGYPPPTAFRDDVDERMALRWMAGLRPGARVALHLHVPYCRRICPFCVSRTQTLPDAATMERFAARLAQQARMVAAVVPEGVGAGALHLGGGTPGLLPVAALTDLTRALGSLGPDAATDISAEIDANELPADWLDRLAEMGLGRAVIGVQDFAPRVQAAIGRRQGRAATAAAVAALRARGVGSVAFDVLYGLPGQTPATLAETLGDLIALAPDRVALTGYAHVPRIARRQMMIRAEAIPDAAARIDLLETASVLLRGAGFQRIGLHLHVRAGDPLLAAARQGRLRYDLLGYAAARPEAVIGLGPSAVSRFEGGYVRNSHATSEWLDALAQDRHPIAGGHVLMREDRLRGEAIERLLCDLALVPARLSDPAGGSRLVLDLLARWPDAFETRTDGAIVLRPEAYPLTRVLASALDPRAYEAGRYGLAV